MSLCDGDPVVRDLRVAVRDRGPEAAGPAKHPLPPPTVIFASHVGHGHGLLVFECNTTKFSRGTVLYLKANTGQGASLLLGTHHKRIVGAKHGLRPSVCNLT